MELQAAANGTLPGMSNLSPEQQAELKSSAQYYLDHDDRFKQMETIQGAPADGACNVDDLMMRAQALPSSRRFSGKNFGAANMVAGASSRDIQGANNPVDADEVAAIRGLLNNRSLITNSNGAIGNVELQAAANGTLPGMSNLSPEQQAELKSSAQYYLDHDDRFKQMETIQGAPADGACNVDDLILRGQALTIKPASSGNDHIL